MKKILCVVAAFIALLVLYFALRNPSVQYPYVYEDKMPLNISCP
jgi:hypothetical protein